MKSHKKLIGQCRETARPPARLQYLDVPVGLPLCHPSSEGGIVFS